MSEHLPIQRWVIRHVAGDAYIDKEPEGSWVTYPDHLAALRACEERVLAGDERWIRASTEANHRIAYRLGHDAALDAAREAVATMTFDPLQRDQGPVATQRQVLAAIDALREKP